MTTITSFLSPDHKRCDDFFIAAETAVSNQEWLQANTAFQAFSANLAQHFAMEEEVLFPAFEAQTGNTAGPTQVMRGEHAQMRELASSLQSALATKDVEAYLGHSETLNIMSQQHNLKEENVLYPMSDRLLSGQANGLVVAMHAFSHSTPVH